MAIETFPQYWHPTHGTPCWAGPTGPGDALCEHKLMVSPSDATTFENLMHTRRCLAGALIAAVENLRDTQGLRDFDFRIAVQNNEPLEMADEYLKTGLFTCICNDV